MTSPLSSRRRRARTRPDHAPGSRADAAEQWIVWRDYDREVEWAASALLALEALARFAPTAPARRVTR